MPWCERWTSWKRLACLSQAPWCRRLAQAAASWCARLRLDMAGCENACTAKQHGKVFGTCLCMQDGAPVHEPSGEGAGVASPSTSAAGSASGSGSAAAGLPASLSALSLGRSMSPQRRDGPHRSALMPADAVDERQPVEKQLGRAVGQAVEGNASYERRQARGVESASVSGSSVSTERAEALAGQEPGLSSGKGPSVIPRIELMLGRQNSSVLLPVRTAEATVNCRLTVDARNGKDGLPFALGSSDKQSPGPEALLYA